MFNFQFFLISKDVRLPVQLQRAMAAEAEAAREARAKVIAAEGEHKASSALKEAAHVIEESPHALQVAQSYFIIKTNFRCFPRTEKKNVKIIFLFSSVIYRL